ncbi:hypothetical protein VKT23_015751 [Stygiomarasmius scandens]|uniref:Fungal-type protein kinase domain-containing protein n=1 Tax=Marasmiellus scandens TaxID=2682957 RepID=A0ABR1IYM3_9AGAR
MHPEELGWDTTMMLCQPNGVRIHPYVSALKQFFLSFFDSAFMRNTNWAIKIKGMEYVTIRVLSLSRAEIMCGRGQLIWLAVNTTDKQQSWAPFTTGDSVHLRDEANMYLLTKNGHLPNLLSNEVVRRTRTCQDFRKGLKGHASAEADTSVDEKSTKGGGDNSLTITKKLANITKNTMPFTERQLTRLVISKYGYPCKCFRSRTELLKVFLDAIDGYEELLRKGIVHGDLSWGNIIICPDLLASEFDPSNISGTLIDLDHAKLDSNYKVGPVNIPDELLERTKTFQNFEGLKAEDDFEDEVVLAMLLSSENASVISYADHLRRVYSEKLEEARRTRKKLSVKDLCLVDPQKILFKPPMFKDFEHEGRSVHPVFKFSLAVFNLRVQGTLPSMLARLMVMRKHRELFGDKQNILFGRQKLSREGPEKGTPSSSRHRRMYMRQATKQKGTR